MYFLISAALLVNAAFAATWNTQHLHGLSGASHGFSGASHGFSGASHGLSGLSGISGLSGVSGLSGGSDISGLSGYSAGPAVSEVVVGGAANQGLFLGGAGGFGSGEVAVGGAAPALSGATVVGEQGIGGEALTTGAFSAGTLPAGFAPLGVTTYTAQAPAVKNIYRDNSHVHPAKEIVYKIRTPPKVHQKVVKIQQVVKQPKINVLEVVQSPKIQKLSILEKPAKQIVNVMPTTHTHTQYVVKAPEAPMTQKVFYSEKARESSGNIVSYEKHNIRPAQVNTISAGAPGGVYVSHSGPTYTGGQTYTAGVLGGENIQTIGLNEPTLPLGGAVQGQNINFGAVGGETFLPSVEGQTLNVGAIGGQSLGLGSVSGQTLNFGGVSGQNLNFGGVSGQTFNLGGASGQAFESTLGADHSALNLGAIGGQGIELGAGALSADSETALNLGSAVGGGNVKTWVDNNANGFTHHKVVKGGDLATWNAEFGSSTFGAGHDLTSWKKK